MTVTEFVIICSVLNIATETVKSAQHCFLYMSKILHVRARGIQKYIFMF